MLNWGRKKIKKTSQIVQPKFSDFHETYENKQTNHRLIHFNDKEQPQTKSNRVITARYNFLSFIPLFFIEQLRHFPNQYFIFVSILQQIPNASPVGRFTVIIPLSIIIGLSAFKVIIEDIKNHRNDRKMNNKQARVLRNGVLVKERWSEIGVGDVLIVENNDMLPVDLVLLSTSDELCGICRIDTTNLDGEIDLKIRHCPRETSCYNKPHDFINLNGMIECELPNKILYNFLGRLTLGNNCLMPLDERQFLPRGSVLRKTKWIYGVAVYTGHETKLMLNRNVRFVKKSKMDTILNSQIKIVFLSISLLSFVCATCSTWWTKLHFESHWYIYPKDFDAYTFFLQTISFFILFHNTVPVTLQVYIELVRFIQAWFIRNDIDMYHEESNTPAMARSPNLNFELGKVKYIFSDKTGTLTKNIMKLKHCSIAGELYLDGSQDKIINKLIIGHSTKNYILDFFRIILLCHTAIPEKSKHIDEIVYNTSSPDEQALVVGSQKFGFTFQTRNPKSVTVKIVNSQEHYEILNIIEFTNSRQKMSVIVRTPDSKIKLYCKGADVAVFNCLSKNGEKYKNQTVVHLNNFARAGFRTLCYACVDISESFYETWKKEYLEASTVLVDRDVAKNRIAEKIERELELIGATAIENELQDNVPKTIQALMNAGIKLWILTGDKQEAAIHIGLSTKLIAPNSSIIIFNESNLTDLKQAIHKQISNLDVGDKNNNNCTLVIDGRSLKLALSNDLQLDFLKICINCISVICCRITPTQKAEIVDLVTKYTNEVTLAISDGANDVPMLHKASIGVGILGLDGLQASNASDYSIAQFKYLSKLLFVHGTWNYERISKMIFFYYYKSICFYALQLWFAIYSGWSGQVLFDRWNICMYNVIFTAVSPLTIGLFLNSRTANERLTYPRLYSQTKNLFNYKTFWTWISVGVLHSIILFWVCLFVTKHETIWSEGRTGDFSVLGNVIYTCTLVITCLKAGLHVQSWSIVVHLSTWMSILSWISFVIIHENLKKILLDFSICISLNEIIFGSALFWITLIFTTSVILIVDITIITIKRMLWHNNDVIIEKKENV